MVVHFPIAFWISAAGAWLVAVVGRKDAPWRFGLWLLSLGTAGALLAVALGFMAADAMGHDTAGHELVHDHRNIMLATTGLALLLTGLAWWQRKAGRAWRVGLTVGSLVLLALMTLGADRGAELVFRYGMGVANETPPHEDHEHADEDHEHADEDHEHADEDHEHADEAHGHADEAHEHGSP